MVPGDQWPIFLYAGYEYDPEDPWKGLFRSSLLVSVGVSFPLHDLLFNQFLGLQTHFYISQLGRQGSQSNAIRKCQDSWHDSGHASFDLLRRHTGADLSHCGVLPYNPSLITLCRSVLDFPPRPSFRGQIRLPILNASTTVSLTSSMTLMSRKRSKT
jgi:hypothetical protein